MIAPAHGGPRALAASTGERAPTVLVLDRGTGSGEGVARALEGMECAVTCLGSAEEALSVLRTSAVDVVVACLALASRRGVEELVAVRDRATRPLRILATGPAEPSSVAVAVNGAGVFRLVERPFDRGAIRRAVHLALDSIDQEIHRLQILDLVRSTPALGAIAEQAPRDAPGGRVVLAVEDPLTCQGMTAALAGAPCRVVVASSAEGALAEARVPGADVVVADHEVGGGEGTALLCVLRDMVPDPVRILVTGRTEGRMAPAAINQAEVFRLLGKPLQPGAMRSGVAAALTLASRRRRERQVLQAVSSDREAADALARERMRVRERPPSRPVRVVR